MVDVPKKVRKIEKALTWILVGSILFDWSPTVWRFLTK